MEQIVLAVNYMMEYVTAKGAWDLYLTDIGSQVDKDAADFACHSFNPALSFPPLTTLDPDPSDSFGE